MKRGILKKTSAGSSSSGRRAKWNEDNLEANEVIKSELKPTKIDEPKTPYHAPVDPEIDMEPLDLEDGQWQPSAWHDQATGRSTAVPQLAVVPASPTKGDFSKQRLKHYDMKAAIALGKKLCNEDVEKDAASAAGESPPA
eukprot:jgi/Ulvmu1/10559/UM065_0013.1